MAKDNLGTAVDHNLVLSQQCGSVKKANAEPRCINHSNYFP